MQFPKAQKVKINQSPSHLQHNLLAHSFNEKIMSGLGDCAWRIFYYAYSMFRSARNPNGDSFPAQDEWFKFYANLEPKMSFGRFGWPETPAGEAEGANVSNPFMSWIFGNNSRVKKADGTIDNTKDRIHGYWSEPIRLSNLEIAIPPSMPKKTSGDPGLNIVWSDSQIQRGCAAFIPNYSYIQAGSATVKRKELQLLSIGVVAAARRHLRYVVETTSMGNYAPSYVPGSQGRGGVFRKKNAVKDQIEQALYYYNSYFRGTEDQRAKHNFSNQNVVSDGFDFETFFSKQFLLAPNYSTPRYELDENNNPRIDNFGNKKIKYDSYGYPELYPDGVYSFSWTYNLAKGISNLIKTQGPTDPLKQFYFKGGPANSTEFDTNPNPNVDKNRFCLSAIFIQSSDIAARSLTESPSLLNGAFIDVYVDGKIYESIPIFAEDKYKISNRTVTENEKAVNRADQYAIFQFNKIHYFYYPVKGRVSFVMRGSMDTDFPSPSSHGKMDLGLPLPESSSFSITIKFAHVLEMKPSSADAYVVLRVATTDGMGVDAGEMDPVGHFNGDTAKLVFSNYIKYGVAYNLHKKTIYQNDAYVSANPVYESVRKFISSNIRMADRVAFVDYEIDNDGNSILYFNRYAMGMKNTGLDIFRNMGPSITEVGNRYISGSSTETFIPIIKGKEYIVLDSNKDPKSYIVYVNNNGKAEILKHGTIFNGSNYYYVSKYVPAGSSKIGVYELDGITSRSFISDEPKKKIFVNGIEQISSGNISNEWAMFMTYNLYHPSDSSYWKPSSYGDVLGALNARCLTASRAMQENVRTSKNVKLNLANVSWRLNKLGLVTEAPSGYNYIEGANTTSQYGDLKENAMYTLNFAASCPIYAPPYYIKSITRVNPNDPKSSLIKVVINGRLNGAAVTDASGVKSGKLSEAINAWNLGSDPKARYFRSDENAVIDYLCHILGGTTSPREVIGDVSMDNQNFWDKQRPFGCCYPRFYFVKLIPYVSANTLMYSDHYRQMEYYLRAMCNGFINKSSEMSPEEIINEISNGNVGLNTPGGYDSAVGDYLFEDLMRNSYDNSSYQAIPPNMVGKQ